MVAPSPRAEEQRRFWLRVILQLRQMSSESEQEDLDNTMIENFGKERIENIETIIRVKKEKVGVGSKKPLKSIIYR